VSAQELITDHLDLWTGAVTKKSSSGRGSNGKVELTGVKKLRELILELAVEGKLVQQESSDKPASELLQAAADEKAQALKDKKIRKSKIGASESVISESGVPDGWAFATLSTIGYWAIGNGFPKAHQGETGLEVLFCKVSDMNLPENSREIHSTVNSVSEQTARSLKLNIHSNGTVIFPKIGGAISTNKRRVIIKPTAIDNNCLGITPTCAISSDYLYLFLTSVDMTQYQVGTSVPALSQGTLGKIPVKLPPLEEQHRIVQKVDELMALCDQLEQQTSGQLEAHETLVHTLLCTLTQSENATELADNWARLAAHFDTLITTEQCIDKLKQTILQLAVMGRLVEQSPFEGNSSVLLQEITDEKNRLVETGALKRKKNNFSRNECELFALPSTWSWVISNEICTLITDGEHNTPERTSDATAVPLATAKNVRDGYIDLANTDFVPLGVAETCWKRCKPEVGDILMVSVGATLGRLAMMRDSQDMVLVRSVTLLRPMKVLGEYLAVYLRAPTTQSWIWRNVRQSAQPCLYLSKSSSIPIGLPPLAEQHRIVQKVDELMALCDELKERLNQASETRCQLAEAVVEEALN
jgi:type I restriction enzyme S subunit